MQLKKANPDLKVLISIGGWLVKSTPFNRILIDKKALRTFINHVITFMDKWNFDGLDVGPTLNQFIKLLLLFFDNALLL